MVSACFCSLPDGQKLPSGLPQGGYRSIDLQNAGSATIIKKVYQKIFQNSEHE